MNYFKENLRLWTMKSMREHFMAHLAHMDRMQQDGCPYYRDGEEARELQIIESALAKACESRSKEHNS